jgi:hypothetical protein
VQQVITVLFCKIAKTLATGANFKRAQEDILTMVINEALKTDILLKGIVPQNFRPMVFFIEQSQLGP